MIVLLFHFCSFDKHSTKGIQTALHITYYVSATMMDPFHVTNRAINSIPDSDPHSFINFQSSVIPTAVPTFTPTTAPTANPTLSPTVTPTALPYCDTNFNTSCHFKNTNPVSDIDFINSPELFSNMSHFVREFNTNYLNFNVNCSHNQFQWMMKKMECSLLLLRYYCMFVFRR
jgi:hypothetical protein